MFKSNNLNVSISDSDCVFAVFKCMDSDKVNGTCRLWTAMDLFIFVLMGFFGGLLGALFNQINKCITIYRMKHVNTKPKYIKYVVRIFIHIGAKLVLLNVTRHYVTQISPACCIYTKHNISRRSLIHILNLFIKLTPC